MIRSRRLWPNISRSLRKRRRSLAPPVRGSLLERLHIARPVPASWISVYTLAAMCAEDAGSAFRAHGAMYALLNAWNGDASRASVCG